ncbi:hypothetical protein BDN72DRAFT_848582 [Pluteus cervinus]|uniref:Uncharacterized protein n=1 Tax=Pluteus cervinus TaxID=181527 RepID=A0ACD3AA24_9AGAR|nr:hypothetical protein BDN72DRAFT_848582 [Pluteus cervinus]
MPSASHQQFGVPQLITPLTVEKVDEAKSSSFYQAGHPPVKELPNEVLQRIFYWTKSTGNPTCVPFSRTYGPMQLAQISSQWRAVAFGTPAIWRDLQCTVYLSPDKYDRQETIAFIQSWISRAAYMPLSILVLPVDLHSDAANPFSPPRISPRFQNVMRNSAPLPGEHKHAFQPWLLTSNKINLLKDIVIPNAPRIQGLHITFPSYYRHTLALLQQSIYFAQLEEITLKLPIHFLDPQLTPNPTYNLLKNAPRLRKLKLGPFPITSHTQLSIDWSHITHLETGVMATTVFFQIFSQARSLQFCKTALQRFHYAGFTMNAVNPTVQLMPPPNHVQLNVIPNLSIHQLNPNPIPMNPNPNPFHSMNPVPNPVWMNPLGPSEHSNIHIPSLHTLDLSTITSSIAFHENDMNFPNLKVLSLVPCTSNWRDLVFSLLKTTTSLSEFHLDTCGEQEPGTLAAMLSHPALSQLTHLSFRLANLRTMPEPLIPDAIDQETLKAIAFGQFVPCLHTFQIEGKISPEPFGHLLTTKGFISGNDINGSTVVIYPDVSDRSRTRPMGVVAPFKEVKILECPPHLFGNPVLKQIQELVGSGRFIMEMSEKDKWARMNQIGWDTDE